MKKIFFLLLFIKISNFAVSQTTDTQIKDNLAIGQWQTYPPFVNGFVAVAQSSETVYFATRQAIVTVDKSDNSLDVINRVSGLNETHIRRLSYNEATKTLIIAYENGNLDLMDSNGKITNINDIKRASVVGTHNIYDIYNKGSEAWLACAFGLVRLDIPNKQITSTTFTPNNETRDVTILNDTIWLATRKGIFWATPNINLLDFGAWQLLPIHSEYSCKQITNFKGQLVASVNDSLFIRRKNGSIDFLQAINNIDEYRSLDASDDHIVAMASLSTNARSVMYQAYDNGTVTQPFMTKLGDCGQIIADGTNNWLADKWYGMVKHTATTGEQSFTYNSPNGVNCRQTAISPTDGTLWSASGAVSDNWSYRFNGDGFYHYQQGQWTNYNAFTYPNIFTPPSKLMLDIICVAIRPSDGHVFVGSYSSENRPFMAECDAEGNNFKMFDANSNSTIQQDPADLNSRRISGMAFDKDNNLWLSNYHAARALSVYRSNGAWQSFDIEAQQPTQIVIDKNNFKWIVGDGGEGIIVFDEGDLDKNGDERIAHLNMSNSSLKSNNIFSLAVDLEGDVWVGTDKGAYVFQCTGSIFDTKNPCKGSQPIVSLEGIREALLIQTSVTAIGVDGANRKWFGTTNGVFVQSPDGRNGVAKFDIDNSPLPSNFIQNFTFDEKNGVVWISTGEGLVSYRTNATHAPQIVVEKPLVFPNPVRPEYSGTIAIRNLARDANVKITDVSGALLYETTANGGQATWDGRDYNGKRAASGVYLVYTTNSLGEQSIVTKFLILN